MSVHPVDLHVGKRLKYRRTLAGLSQEELGKRVGVTFQQIQKYEKGQNRVGASRLYEFSKALDVEVSYFFDEIPDDIGSNNNMLSEIKDSFEYEKLPNKEILALMRSYSAIEDKEIRRKISDLIKSLSDVEA